ncbi:tRNA(fMet)-specific endonuclease VapC [compost metagenome]
MDIVDYGAKAATHYGNIRAVLEQQDTPIGVNDLHIAGHARSEGFVLVTNNLREFERVDGLRLENWL